MALSTVAPRRHRITLMEYHQMGEAGIFGEDDRIELLEGELFDMAPIGSIHANTVSRLIHLFYAAKDQAVLWVQNPIALPDSEPEPDLALLKPGNYWDHLPTATDVLLLIEVADSTVQYDREKKIPLYARFGIVEAWLVDVKAKRVEVYREPGPEGYRTVLIRGERDCVAPSVLLGITVVLAELWKI